MTPAGASDAVAPDRLWLASVTDALHHHAARFPHHLRLQFPPGGIPQLQPGKAWRRLQGDGGRHPLPQLNPTAVHSAAALLTGVLVKNGLQIMQRLRQLQPPGRQEELFGDRPQRRFAAPWSGLFRDRRHSDQRNLPRNAAALAAKAHDRQKAQDPQGAIPYLEEALRLNPSNVDLLVLLAKQWSDSSFTDSWPERERVPANEKAIAYSQQAIEADPTSAMGYVASCMSKGRLAYWTKDNKMKIQYAKQAQDEVAVALQLDPSNDLAHHLMGRWHYEMAQLNFVVRSLVRVLYGTHLVPGSVPDALESYRRAAQLNPRRLVHHVEVGRMLHKLGDDEAAMDSLQTALQLEIEDINSAINQEEARDMAADIQRRLKRASISQPALPKLPQFAAPRFVPFVRGAN